MFTLPDAKWFLFLFGGILLGLAGCNVDVSTRHAASDDAVVAEGTLFSVKYDLGDGKTGGFTRLDTPNAVPGGNGNWNVDAHGKLTSKFLIVTYPPDRHLGPLVIPAEKLYEVQFGDGGIPKIHPVPNSGHHEE